MQTSQSSLSSNMVRQDRTSIVVMTRCAKLAMLEAGAGRSFDTSCSMLRLNLTPSIIYVAAEEEEDMSEGESNWWENITT